MINARLSLVDFKDLPKKGLLNALGEASESVTKPSRPNLSPKIVDLKACGAPACGAPAAIHNSMCSSNHFMPFFCFAKCRK